MKYKFVDNEILHNTSFCGLDLEYMNFTNQGFNDIEDTPCLNERQYIGGNRHDDDDDDDDDDDESSSAVSVHQIKEIVQCNTEYMDYLILGEQKNLSSVSVKNASHTFF